MNPTAKKSSVQAQPLIAVRDVRASSRWYAELLGADSLPEHVHRDLYERISCSGQLILQLHAWDAENHPNLVNREAAPAGHGVLLWFEVNDFDSVVERARRLQAEILLLLAAGWPILWQGALSLRRLRPGSFLITPRGSRRGAAFRVSGCWAYPATAPAGRSTYLRAEAA